MSSLYQDPQYTDLVWIEFDGKTWDDFNNLLSELMEMTKTLETPYCLIFDPQVDMPRGNPLPHIQRMMRYMDQEPKFDHMIAIVPTWMKIAAMFTRIVMKLFSSRPAQNWQGSAVSREEAMKIYMQYHTSKEIVAPIPLVD